MEQRQAKLIDLNEWERPGGGGTGWSYINRNDCSIMLKLNKKEISEEVSYHEYLISVHGDLSPGNIIRADGKDYWIDLGDFTYGDPDMDFACLAFLARYTPTKVVEYLFHLTKRQIGQFIRVLS